MRMKILGAAVAILAGAGLLFLRPPSIEARLASMEPELNARLDAREVQIDPAELVDLIYNFNTSLNIIDIRDETDYNLFHIIDARRASIEHVRDPKWVETLPEQTVIVLASNDEASATRAWKLLSAQDVENLYILEGGINYWLTLFDTEAGGTYNAERPAPRPDGDDTLRHGFTAALGGNHPASDLDPTHLPERDYKKKVRPIGPITKKTGGCG